MTANNKITKSISALLVISILLPTVLFSKPQRAEAQFVPVNDTLGNKLLTAITKATGGTLKTTGGSELLAGKTWFEYIGTQLLKMIAKNILARMTQATVDWINRGFEGSPLFLENPESFFKDIVKAQVRFFVDMIGYDDFRFPFGKQTALNVIASYNSQLAINAQYSLSAVQSDLNLPRFRNDFNYGGWNGFLINTQYPQNNYLGFNTMIGQSLGSQLTGALQAPAQKVQSLLQQGLGFLSPQTCMDNGGVNTYNDTIANQFRRPTFQSADLDTNDPKYAGSSGSTLWEKENNAARAKFNQDNTCKNLVSTTPGYVAATQIANALDSPRMMTLLDGALGNSFAAIFDALLNQLIGTGLNSLASTINSGPEDDDWMFEGQRLGGNVSSGNAIASLNINTPGYSVPLLATNTIYRTFHGGKAPYSMIPASVNSNTVGVTFSNNTITIVGKGTGGGTSVTIKDSSDPARSTILNIGVNDPSTPVTFPIDFLAPSTDPPHPADNSIPAGEIGIARISGGLKPYSLVEDRNFPNTAIARVNLADNILSVFGVALGATSVTIKDSSNPNKTYTVPIKITGTADDTSSVSQENTFERIVLYTSGIGNTTERDISFISSERITSTRSDVATAAYIPNTTPPRLRFTSTPGAAGGRTGETKITVKGPNQQIAEFDVQVVERIIFGAQNRYNGNINRQFLSITGGKRPYMVKTYDSSSASILNQQTTESIAPAWIWNEEGKPYLFVEFNGRTGSTIIEIIDSDGQTAGVTVTR